MQQPSDQMMIDTVDQRDRVIGQIRRGNVLGSGHSFRVVHVFVFNKSNELLVQRIHPSRNRHPGYWGSSIAAYVFAGESYEEAARRRLEQEMGIVAPSLHLYGKTSMDDEKCIKHISLFILNDFDGTITPDFTHISQAEWIPIPKLLQVLSQDSRKFAPTTRHLFRYYFGA